MHQPRNIEKQSVSSIQTLSACIQMTKWVWSIYTVGEGAASHESEKTAAGLVAASRGRKRRVLGDAVGPFQADRTAGDDKERSSGSVSPYRGGRGTPSRARYT